MAFAQIHDAIIIFCNIKKLIITPGFTEQAPIGLGDPIEFLHESIRELATRSLSTSTLATTFDMRVEFAMREAQALWNAVLQAAQRGTKAS